MLWNLNKRILYKIGRIKVDLKDWLDQFIEGILRPLDTKNAHKVPVGDLWKMLGLKRI